MTATTSSMRSGLLASSQPQASISAAFARQAHVGVGEMPKRFKRRDNSVPGPWVGGAGDSGLSIKPVADRHILGTPGQGDSMPHREHKAESPSNVQFIGCLSQ
jgi:hypothetical protein